MKRSPQFIEAAATVRRYGHSETSFAPFGSVVNAYADCPKPHVTVKTPFRTGEEFVRLHLSWPITAFPFYLDKKWQYSLHI